jgi:hypothetical protein
MAIQPKFSQAQINTMIQRAKDPMNGLAFSAGASLLDAGRRVNRSGIGMSQSSRQALNAFFDGAKGLFNQLYAKSENGELNNITQIMALRSKYYHLTRDDIKARDETETVPPSTTSGTNVDTTA